ncbi:MAG: hypothetical protein ACJ760_10705 [Thermoleophilaceae bacterium]
MIGRRAIVAAACAVLVAAPQAARADSDPASDILPTQDTFLPYQPKISPDLKAKLQGATKAAKQAGYPIKVAVIATAADLGGVPNLFNQPTKYAAFLGSEINFNKKAQPLLVVMPVGLGTSQAGPRATKAIEGIKVGSGADGLANAALEGVSKLAAASGHPIKGFKPESSGNGSTSAVIFAIPVALLVIVLAVVSYRRAGREDEDEEAPAPS